MTRQDKEELLGQHSVMIWFTGLSGSGKSTIAYTVMGMYGMTGGMSQAGPSSPPR